MLCQGIESEHQRIALLASLGNIVGAAIIVDPVNARRGTELPHVGEQRLQLGLRKQCN